ncbi:MAG: hypothetical protein A3A80_03350 [Candidatus Terrybacteria bacterium RIFCSPLOWO2_01_FULL_44_24]|uniref:Uncharacterized protein n=1 Tax=Candidatus Terrybacteria bacterium RIFCSPHIGHO2_01_FULL_43_35 TaxID=1802361 RepID=A0A1G2PFG5_9BACT|nr:MAG: hypothetical protein A2828_00265 [Candidatus Terrybacteria bacterium RIFCSPHIGHO2_01_FULL_43_35]OHA49722.1 MAG: hypothetical protein A3B75_01840 [Candidatus Terrybacteria bacterium RIFCSPHIGHO2_02_FULL_43_14]OHA51545.1 MAG: hypothetical protein A3A80_03350 [Candidatus Terrybacteria bacterium RIFCSPLOWO2_01_FULL_44_24]
MDKRIIFLILAVITAVFVFGVFTFAACGTDGMNSHMPGMKNCPQAVAAAMHHIGAFLNDFAAISVIAVICATLVLVSIMKIVFPALKVLDRPFRFYLLRHINLLVISAFSYLFSNGILHRKEAHSVIV